MLADHSRIVLGSVDGRLQTTIDKLRKLQTRSPFTFAIIAGDLFADPATSTSEDDAQLQSLLDGSIDIPLQIFFTTGKHALPAKIIDKLSKNNDEVVPNLAFLGKRSTFKTIEGIRIVTLGGVLDPNVMSATQSDSDKYISLHSEEDAKALKGAHNADILITNVWPTNVTSGSKIEVPGDLQPPAEECIATLCAALKPRYHFSSSSELFYEREPFYFPPPDNDPDVRPFTRFISLGSVGSSRKAKYLYAFNIEPASAPPSSLPVGCTPSPFANSSLGKRNQRSQAESYARFDQNDRRGYNDNNSQKRRKKGDRGPRAPPTQDQCFFCLSNPNLSTHLITAIGNDSYLTTSKGPVPTSATFGPLLNFPAHILIIPLAHSPTIASIQSVSGSDHELVAAFTEMKRYRNALNAMLSAHGHGRYGSVCWEISRQDGVHVHWQWMPIESDMIGKGLVEAGFKVEAENAGYDRVEKREDIGSGVSVVGDWFRVWLWQPCDQDVKDSARPSQSKEMVIKTEDDPAAPSPNGQERSDKDGTESTLFLPLDPSQRFDLQFGRRVLAKLLGTPERAHWRDCPQSIEEETKDAGAFKEAFKAWDFSA